MKRLLLAISLSLLLSSPVWATNWCNSAVGCWPMEEGSGTTMADESPNTNTATFYSAETTTWATASPPVATSTAYIDNVGNENIEIADDASINFGTSTDFTAVIWAKYQDVYGGPMGKKTYGSNGDGWRMYINGSSGGYARVNDSDGTDVYSSLTVADVTVWFHLAASYDRDGSLRAYVNGIQTDADSIVNIGQIDTADSMKIGSGGTENDYFGGLLDEAALFASVLDSTDINDIMDNGLVQAAPPAGRTRRML